MSVPTDRFRRRYVSERGCNAKCPAMLGPVPADRRADPRFARAPGRMGHLVAARLAAELGGRAVDTDSIFWSKPARVDAPAASG